MRTNKQEEARAGTRPWPRGDCVSAAIKMERANYCLKLLKRGFRRSEITTIMVEKFGIARLSTLRYLSIARKMLARDGLGLTKKELQQRNSMMLDGLIRAPETPPATKVYALRTQAKLLGLNDPPIPVEESEDSRERAEQVRAFILEGEESVGNGTGGNGTGGNGVEHRGRFDGGNGAT